MAKISSHLTTLLKDGKLEGRMELDLRRGGLLIFLFRREDREEGSYTSFHCRRTRTIPAVNSVAPELNSPVCAPNLFNVKTNQISETPSHNN